MLPESIIESTIQTIREEGLLKNSQERGIQLITGLRKLQEDYPVIGDVRGLGLMIGLEFRSEDRKPLGNIAKSIVKQCFEDNMMLLTCGPWDNTIRFIPPLIITEEEVNLALNILFNALEKQM